MYYYTCVDMCRRDTKLKTFFDVQCVFESLFPSLSKREKPSYHFYLIVQLLSLVCNSI